MSLITIFDCWLLNLLQSGALIKQKAKVMFPNQPNFCFVSVLLSRHTCDIALFPSFHILQN